MENYSFNLAELVISHGCILRKNDASRLYNTILVLLIVFFFCFLYAIIRRWYHDSPLVYLYIVLLIACFIFISISISNKKKTLRTPFDVDEVKTIRFKKKGLYSKISAFLSIYTSAIVELKNGSSTHYRICLDDTSMNEFIFELIDKDIRVEDSLD